MKIVEKTRSNSVPSLLPGGLETRMLTGALIGGGLSLPVLLAVSRITELSTVPLLGMAIGGTVLGAFGGLLRSCSKGRDRKIPAASTHPGGSGLPAIRPLTEVTFRHDCNGDIVSQSGSLHPLLQKLGDAVTGKGLLNRIRISDRPAFLKAVSDAAQGRVVMPVRLAVCLDESPGVYHPFEFSAHWSEEGCISCLQDIPDTAAHRDEPAQLVRNSGGDNPLVVTLGNVAHEMRSPLNSILGFSELLTRGGKTQRDEAQKLDYARRINSAGLHLLGVVEKMLTAGQLEAGRLDLACESFDAARLCRECTSLLEPQLRNRNIQIVTDCPSDLPALYADEKCCRQMLLNILDNAVKFSSADQEIFLTLRKSDGHMEFVVRDGGSGIPDEALPRLARPFERVNGSCRNGTGLGLALVDQMAALHGGSLKLESVLGEGTTVTISLPCVRAAPADTSLVDDDNLFETSLLEPAGGFRRSA